MDSKVFFWSIGSNPWGRYLRISENGAGWGHISCMLFAALLCNSSLPAMGRTGMWC